jgi:hypothetical protein
VCVRDQRGLESWGIGTAAVLLADATVNWARDWTGGSLDLASGEVEAGDHALGAQGKVEMRCEADVEMRYVGLTVDADGELL